MSNPIPDTGALQARLGRAREAAASAGVDALFVSPGSDLRYLLGVAPRLLADSRQLACERMFA